ncbi:uncharacterized protein MYCFIDRAFT_210800 [Pseudocercospora fijiensis CIRAD86]|uniref:Uncharacterized protein n=1 Tax=Pseudocercospora fijiensis (strain CIRAD86) TaxID=383855 RepID=M2ZZ06_PSEFD|nr:uncharacterized protein MYCFIDRAFT_210800 [Pseudocercospora fijiensis CIRAD86]EME84164.1 hypothetical protein MYCFIDRAFT_210800 [Pseudocercospora fijiensis CIRAD86]
MPSAISLAKFVGTISLGLLTGVSYTLSTQSLPSLLTLPSAKPAAYTLNQTTRLATLHIRTLSTLSSASFLLAFALSPSRIRHPYLLWTALVAGAGGALNLLMDRDAKSPVAKRETGEVNGEQVEKRARDQQRLEFIRTAVSGLGLTMSVIGIWGDGA